MELGQMRILILRVGAKVKVMVRMRHVDLWGSKCRRSMHGEGRTCGWQGRNLGLGPRIEAGPSLGLELGLGQGWG